jgi:hypothetical protein
MPETLGLADSLQVFVGKKDVRLPVGDPTAL